MKRNYSEIEDILKYVRYRLEEYGEAQKTIASVSLCVEEILHRYSATATPDTPVLFEVRKSFKELAVIISISGEECPIRNDKDEYPILKNIIKNKYIYQHLEKWMTKCPKTPQ